MKKILIPLFLLFLLIATSFSQQGKLKVGNFTIYDSSGVLVINGGQIKVNDTGWVKPKDLNSGVGGLGISLNKTLGLRLNTGTGITVGANDTVVSTQELSFAEVDSISINGLVLKQGTTSTLKLLDTMSVSRLYTNSIFMQTPATKILFAPELDYSNQLVYTGGKLAFYTDEMDWYTSNGGSPTLMATLLSTGLTLNATKLDFLAGAPSSIGTTDNFDLTLIRHASSYLTLGASNLILEGNTPIKFADGNVLTTTDGITMASLLGVPNGTSATHTGWIIFTDNSNTTIYVPYWR
jgi:hypothetical protein